MSLTEFTISEADLAQAVSDTINPYLADPAKGLQLVTRLIAHPPQDRSQTQQKHLAQLHQLIHQTFVNLSARDDYPAEALAFRELLALEDSLEELSFFPDLANKKIVGVGGGFSAGKSRFLNTLLGDALLPESLEPTTAIPSFLTGGAASIVALNAFSHQVEIDADALQAISHAFYKHYQKTLGDEVGFSHVLKLLMIHRPAFQWDNLAFLDTPGYSKVDGQGAGQTDAQIALKQLTEADHLIWLLNANNGSIRQDDLDFLRTLNHSKPIFFVVTQADLVGDTRIKAILQSVAQAIESAGISSAGLMAWAAPLGVAKGKKMTGDSIRKWLDEVNAAPKYTNKIRTCSLILDKNILHNSSALVKNRVLLAALNELLPSASELSAKRYEAITAQIAELRTAQRSLPALVQEFTELKEAMLACIRQIVGKMAREEKIEQGAELLCTIQTKWLTNALELEQALQIKVVSVVAETRKVNFLLDDDGMELWLPFSLIRSDWGIDPLTLAKGSLLSGVVRDLDDRAVTIAIANPNATI